METGDIICKMIETKDFAFAVLSAIEKDCFIQFQNHGAKRQTLFTQHFNQFAKGYSESMIFE